MNFSKFEGYPGTFRRFKDNVILSPSRNVPREGDDDASIPYLLAAAQSRTSGEILEVLSHHGRTAILVCTNSPGIIRKESRYSPVEEDFFTGVWSVNDLFWERLATDSIWTVHCGKEGLYLHTKNMILAFHFDAYGMSFYVSEDEDITGVWEASEDLEFLGRIVYQPRSERGGYAMEWHPTTYFTSHNRRVGVFLLTNFESAPCVTMYSPGGEGCEPGESEDESSPDQVLPWIGSHLFDYARTMMGFPSSATPWRRFERWDNIPDMFISDVGFNYCLPGHSDAAKYKPAELRKHPIFVQMRGGDHD